MMTRYITQCGCYGVIMLLSLACSIKGTREPTGEKSPFYRTDTIDLSESFFEISPQKNSATSKILKTPITAQFMAVTWPTPKNFVYDNQFLFRSSPDGKKWSRWKDVFLMEDGPDEEKFDRSYSNLIYTNRAQFFQFK